jgi:hypothetical protein
MARKQLQPVKFTGKTPRMRDILDWLNEHPNREVRFYDYKSGRRVQINGTRVDGDVLSVDIQIF